MSVIIIPEELYNTYVEIDKNMLLDVNNYDSLIRKAKLLNYSFIMFLFFYVNICSDFLLCYEIFTA